MRAWRGVWLAVAGALLLPGAAVGQSFGLKGYALGVGTYSAESAFSGGGSTQLARFRLMPELPTGDLTLDVAYEHVLVRSPADGGFSVTAPGGTQAGSTDWLPLDNTIRTTSRSTWRSRFDRLSVGFEAGPLTVTVGRQAISWATTLFLTPADPFAPFDPSDPFREYRGGVDAVRVQAFTGAFSEIDVVVRGADTSDGGTVSALARYQTSLGVWALGWWGGVVHEELSAAVFTTGAVGSTALRAEMVVRERPGDDAAFRGSFGADRQFLVDGKDGLILMEIQYDGFGVTESSDLLDVITSKPFLRGEMQTLGRWTGAAQASLQIHPLVGVDALAITNLTDGSTLLGPGLSWSASGSVSVRAGAFFGFGADDLDPLTGLVSEYGAVPGTGYVAASWYF
jgi:hypothetical protein